MTEAAFEEMLQRYLDGTSRPGERELVARWSNQLGAPQDIVLSAAEREQVRAAMWHQVERLTLDAGEKPAARSRILGPPAAFWQAPVLRWAAAAVLVLGGAGALALLRQAPAATHTPAIAWVWQRNAGPQVQLLRLADSSRVALSPGSSLQYRPGLAGARREVRLKGEAFFQVAKNPARPFLVYTDQLVTTVLGTSFRVKAYAGRNNEVAVREGRVSVQVRRGADLRATPVQPAAGGVVLLPNQQVVFAALDPHPLRKNLVANPVIVVPQAFTFTKQPVAKVLQALEKAYGVDILYDANKVANCTITVTFYQESLYEKLDLLSKALGAHYAPIDDARIQFDTNGCAP
ncbi:FecR family protein [Hymenobacter nivis]|uniref:FecR family protein n=1 Tax=Hymenobacter nivis TaxID=1850093 RepID=A0A502GLI1_9BACT|nr:FecR family protein [Hymenobacter nivis]TPG62358.1 FecR family protein [Hymenobacter nivis]